MPTDMRPRPDVYTAKARVEIAELEARGIVLEGNAFSAVLLVKGEMGPAEQGGGALLSGADGVALRAALLKLGYPPEAWEAMAAWHADGTPIGADEARLALAALDPDTVIACDEVAANLLRGAYTEELFAVEDPDEALLAPGHIAHVSGMRMLNLGGFEAALASDAAKQLMWARLKLVPPLGEPY